MQRASFSIAVRTAQLLRESTGGIVGGRVLLLVGSGDNGGDALYAGSYLCKRGVDVRAVLVASTSHASAMTAFRQAGGEFIPAGEISTFSADIVLDGIVGTGLQGALNSELNSIVQWVNEQSDFVIAIDIPSGVLANTGEVLGMAVQADVTLTIGALKVGLLTGSGSALVGILDLIDIGVIYPSSKAIAHVLDFDDVFSWYPTPQHNSYKYSRGVVGLEVGSEQYPGAALLAVGGALTSGAGMVRISSDVASEVINHYPEVVFGLEDEHITAYAIGSGGAGTSEKLANLLRHKQPVVMDAYALHFLDDPYIKQLISDRNNESLMTIVTPHEGEASRLGFSGSTRLDIAQQIARELQVTVVLKGPGTLIADPQGVIFIDVYGTSVLATAGTGDVLTGLIAGTLSCQPNPTTEVVAAAVALHGLAGRRLPTPATASDLITSLMQVRADQLDRQE